MKAWLGPLGCEFYGSAPASKRLPGGVRTIGGIFSLSAGECETGRIRARTAVMLPTGDGDVRHRRAGVASRKLDQWQG